ncbi:elongation factor G [Rubrivivax gelatinosus]|uniref:Elongation factor G n=1 Tax=Rubrivivax gelatinosus (strain NBRC 100245 / IL144) TaxID=983917 RepID=I0HLJ8_RUBGI|nr:elongation factor G [Rubrivivax gelatinosus]BAL93885.1 elongation factor G FusA [Rubrivivax gelatinosus IL144]
MNSNDRNLRNIGVIAHVDAGKTTVTERILFHTGENHRIGEVHDGSARMDFDPQERQRGITIDSAAVSVQWKGAQINIIDTPGHIDFNVEVRRALRVLDGAVVVFDGVAGVEPQTETNWRLADGYGVPRIAFVNKLDRVGADFRRVVSMIGERLGVKALVLQLPIGAEGGFRGVVDLLAMRSLVWPHDDASEPPQVGAVPPELLDLAVRERERLLEAVVEQDDELLLAYLNGQALPVEALRRAIRKGVLAQAFVPVLGGSAYRNRGVEPLLDAVVDFLPRPGDLPATENRPAADARAPLAALAFKLAHDGHAGMVFVRVYSGRLRRGDTVLNTVTGRVERVSRLYEVHADERIDIDEAQAGDIVAVVGLKDTLTGHTLSDRAHPVQLETISVPEPVIDVALEPLRQADQQALTAALALLQREDPSLRVRQDAESGQLILSGMGELQLEVAVERLRSRHGIDAAVGRPEVAYRESISKEAEVNHVHRKQSGGPGQFAELRLRLAPLERGAGLRFESRITGGAIPKEFIPAVEAGVRRAAQSGVLAGFPTVDLQATLLDGSFHERDSSTLAFDLAAAAAFREAAAQAGPVLLEPVMAVEVITPQDHLGDVIGDLHRRRGTVRAHGSRGNAAVIDAEVPLKEMFGYIGSLRALSQGRAQYTMQFDRYRQAAAERAASMPA